MWNSRSRSRNRSTSVLLSIRLCTSSSRSCSSAVSSGRLSDQRERLEALAHLVDDVDLVLAEPRDPRALVRLVLGEALGLEHPQRLAHRQPARAEPLRDVLLPDPVAGPESPVQDLLAEERRDPGARGAAGVGRGLLPCSWPRILPVERLAAGVGDQLELHAPGAEEVDPPVALRRAAAGGRPVEHLARRRRAGARRRRRGRRRTARRGDRRCRCCAAAPCAGRARSTRTPRGSSRRRSGRSGSFISARGWTARWVAIQSSSWRNGPRE